MGVMADCGGIGSWLLTGVVGRGHDEIVTVLRAEHGSPSCRLPRDTADMKKRIKSLEEEKERLNDKVTKAKGQVDKIADRQTYMDACSALRKQQDEEVSLSVQLQVCNIMWMMHIAVTFCRIHKCTFRPLWQSFCMAFLFGHPSNGAFYSTHRTRTRSWRSLRATSTASTPA